MSDTSAATLPASMLSPVNALEKAASTAQSGLREAEKTQTEGLADKDKALAGEGAELKRQREQTAQFSIDHPFPHPNIKTWEEKPPQNNPIERFGSWASAFGIVASVITKKGLASSLNASAAAMNAIRKNDMDGYEEAKKVWKENTEIAIQQADWEAKGYTAAFELMKTDQAAGLAQAQVVAAQADNKIMLGELKKGNVDSAFQISKSLGEFALQGPERMLQVQKAAQELEQTRERAKLFGQWKTKHPDASEEQTAQVMTQIMSPQYTINQAKTLAEGAGGPGAAGSMANDPVTLDYWAKRVRAGEPMPSLGIGKDAAVSRRLIAQRAAHSAYDEGGTAAGDMVKKATLNAEKDSLKLQVKNQHSLHAFEQTALANGRAALNLIDKVDSTGSPVIERWIRAGRKEIAGDPDVTAFNTQLAVFVPEVAKILNNPTLGSVLSDSARIEAQNLIPQNVTAEQLKRIIPLLEADFGRRDKALTEEIEGTKDNIIALADMNPGDAAKSFPDEAAAQAAVKAGTVHVGDTIMIGGKAHTVEK